MSAMESPDCLICAFPIDGDRRLFSYGVCAHKDICSICFLRIRSLQRNFTCPSCKSHLDKVICSENPSLVYSDFNLWGDSIGPDFTYDERSQMFFPNAYYRFKISALWLNECSICSQQRRDMKGLRTHIKVDHNLELCLLCLENRDFFPCEHRYYTQEAYKTHLRCGDGDGSLGHPSCEFCRKRYYDKTALFTHLQQDHFSCHICTKLGILYKYYATYDSLETHFRAEHYICEDAACLEKKFVVFSNSIELTAHSRQWHPLGLSQRQRIVPMHFKMRRPGDDDGDTSKPSTHTSNSEIRHDDNPSRLDSNGSRFDGGLGGRAHKGEWQIELAYVPTDPRDASRSTGAAAASEMISTFSQATTKGSEEEEFPALPSDGRTMNSAPLWAHGATATMGGGKKGARNKRDNEFPTLPAGVLKPSSSLKSNSTSIGAKSGAAPLKSNSQASLKLSTKSNLSEMSYVQIPRASSSPTMSNREPTTSNSLSSMLAGFPDDSINTGSTAGISLAAQDSALTRPQPTQVLPTSADFPDFPTLPKPPKTSAYYKPTSSSVASTSLASSGPISFRRVVEDSRSSVTLKQSPQSTFDSIGSLMPQEIMPTLSPSTDPTVSIHSAEAFPQLGSALSTTSKTAMGKKKIPNATSGSPSAGAAAVTGTWGTALNTLGVKPPPAKPSPKRGTAVEKSERTGVVVRDVVINDPSARIPGLEQYMMKSTK